MERTPGPPLEALISRAARGEKLSDEKLRSLTDAASETWSVLAALHPQIGGADILVRQLDLLRKTAHLTPRCRLTIDGLTTDVPLSLAGLWRFYLPLCSALRELDCGAPPPSPRLRRAGALGCEFRRGIIGLAGPPGSGKSTFAALLAALMHALGVPSVVVPLDGFHFPNAYLDTHRASGPDGAQVSLRLLKGSPETFDVAAFVEAVRRLRREPSLSLPVYDRRVHDPVADRIQVSKDHRLAIVEGNYLLLEGGEWAELRHLLDFRLFLTVPFEVLREGLIARHIRGGRTRPDAERHFELVDRRNYVLCMSSAQKTDVIIECDEGHLAKVSLTFARLD